MKKIIINLAKKNQILRTILRKIKNIKGNIKYKKYCRKNQVQENLIVFESFLGKQYTCSPKAIYLAMIKDEKFNNFEYVWAFKNTEKYENVKELKKAIIVEYGSDNYYEYYSKAKYIVTNSRIPDEIKIRDNQKYIQTWHGTPLKRLGYDLEIEKGNAMNSLKDVQDKYKKEAERITYMISPSKFTTKKLESAFNLKENNSKAEILEVGYPRNDFLYTYTDEDIDKIKEKLDIQNIDKKIILYAPTWRDNEHKSGVGYTYTLKIDFDELQKQLSDEYIILFRAHYFIANSFDFKKYSGFIYNVSDVDDINELYVISDMLITDYSSVFFDYANLKRPIIFYMYDLENYKDNIRGFYIDINELPGNILQTEEELIAEIKNMTKNFKYDERYRKFNETYTYLDDGKSAKRVIDIVVS